MNFNINNKILTVIIPIHNSLKFKRNILRILKENHAYCEFILIDDGDNYDLFKHINHGYFNKINIIHNKKNRGVSYSRNIGIKFCKTKYLTFVDADDFILLNQEFADFLKAIINIDIIMCKNNISIFNKEIYFSNKNNLLNISKSVKNNLIINYLRKPVGLSPLIHCWGNIYSTNFLRQNKISFNNNLRTHEDSLFFAKCLTESKKIKFYNYSLYRHVVLSKTLSFETPLSPSSFLLHLEIYNKYLRKNNVKNTNELYLKATSYYLAKSLVGILNLSYLEIYRRLINISRDKKIKLLLKKIKFKCEKIPALDKWMLNYPPIAFIIIFIKKISEN